MKKHIFIAALVIIPGAAIAAHPEGGLVNDIKSEIREDYRQLHEDQAAGDIDAVRDDERQLAEDKMRLREAIRNPHRLPPPPPPHDRVMSSEFDAVQDIPPPPPEHHKPPIPLRDNQEVNAAPPPPDHDELRDKHDRAQRLNPDRPFNRAAHVDNEIR